MLSKEENDLLCRTGPGTPMGNLFRRFWLPVALSRELPKTDCPPVRLRIRRSAASNIRSARRPIQPAKSAV